MREYHYTPLNHMLDNYSQNLYLDRHHHAQSFNSLSSLHRKPHTHLSNYNDHELDHDEEDRQSIHSQYSCSSTHSLPILFKRSSSNFNRDDHHQQDSSSYHGSSPTRSEFYKSSTNSHVNSSTRNIKQHQENSIKPTRSEIKQNRKRKEELLKDYMKRNQLRMVEAQSNGNCLFNSISLALFDSEHKNHQLRQLCVDWIEENLNTPVKDGIKIRDLIFLKPEQANIEEYLHSMRQEREWADYCCLNALSNLLECELEVVYVNYRDGHWFVQSEIQVEPITHSTCLPKIRLMYIEDLKHYNLLIKCK